MKFGLYGKIKNAIKRYAHLIYYEIKTYNVPSLVRRAREEEERKKRMQVHEEKIYCLYCGEKLPSHASYCLRCGKKVE